MFNILPQRVGLIQGQVPQAGNSLARGLVGVAVPVGGKFHWVQNFKQTAAGQVAPATSTPFVMSGTNFAQSYNNFNAAPIRGIRSTNGSNTQDITLGSGLLEPQALTEMTMMVVCLYDNTLSGNQFFFCLTDTNTLNISASLGIFTNSQVGFQVKDSVGSDIADGAASNLVLNQPLVLVGVRSSSRNIMQNFCNGQAGAGNTTFTATGGNFTPNTISLFGDKTNGLTSNGSVYLAAYWNRALLPAEIAQVSANPWAVLGNAPSLALLSSMADVSVPDDGYCPRPIHPNEPTLEHDDYQDEDDPGFMRGAPREDSSFEDSIVELVIEPANDDDPWEDGDYQIQAPRGPPDELDGTYFKIATADADEIDDEDDAGFVRRAPDNLDASIFEIFAVETDDDDLDADDAGFVEGPLEDTVQADATVVARLAADLDDDAEDDDFPQSLAAPLDDAPAPDGTIVRALASEAEDADQDDEDTGFVRAAPDDLDASIVPQIAVRDDDELVDEDDAGFVEGPAADLADATVISQVAGSAEDDEFEDLPADVAAAPLADLAAVADAVVIRAIAPADGEDDLGDGEPQGSLSAPRADAPIVAATYVDVAYETLRAWLIANWSATALRFENETLDPPAALAAFVFFEVWSEFVDVAEIGAGNPHDAVWREEGEAVFHIVVASGSGALQVRDYAEQLALKLRGLVLANGVRIGALSIGSGEQLAVDGSYFDLPLSAQWARDNWVLGSN